MLWHSSFLCFVFLRDVYFVDGTLSRFKCVTKDGVWIGELDLLTHLHTTLGITSNYSAIANLHTLKITTPPAKPFFQPDMSLTVVT
jgi:hypothetical protein